MRPKEAHKHSYELSCWINVLTCTFFNIPNFGSQPVFVMRNENNAVVKMVCS